MPNYYVKVTDVVGYTRSDGSVLCPTCADDGTMPDVNNQTGFVYPVFAGDETSIDMSCDVCGEIVLEANIKE